MITYFGLAVFLAGFCLVAHRLDTTIITAPMVFLGAGTALGYAGLMPELATELALHRIAEIALVVLLFLDAAKIDAIELRRRHVWPARMLLIGLPLGFVLGTGLGWFLLPGWPLAAIALIAAILVPTDAALGQPVVSNEAVPVRTRRALTVESGLNDGMALPLVLLMAAFAAPMAMSPPGGWAFFGLKQIILGPMSGLAVGCIGGIALLWAKRVHATSETYEGIGALALAAAAYLAAGLIGGNGFIAAFAAGLGFGAIVRGKCAFVYEFTEGEGQILSWTSFFLIGVVLVPEAIAHLTLLTLILILTSLLVVRPLAIWLSLMGTDAATNTRLFMGWFGPRGLATALFALLVAEQLDHELAEQVLHIAINAVWISEILHGLTAAPFAKWYGARAAEPTS